MSIADRLRVAAASINRSEDHDLAELLLSAADRLDEQLLFESRTATIASQHGVDRHDVVRRVDEILTSLEHVVQE